MNMKTLPDYMITCTTNTGQGVIFAWGSVLVLRIAMDILNEGSSKVELADVASFAVGDAFSSYDDLKKPYDGTGSP